MHAIWFLHVENEICFNDKGEIVSLWTRSRWNNRCKMCTRWNDLEQNFPRTTSAFASGSTTTESENKLWFDLIFVALVVGGRREISRNQCPRLSASSQLSSSVCTSPRCLVVYWATRRREVKIEEQIQELASYCWFLNVLYVQWLCGVDGLCLV